MRTHPVDVVARYIAAAISEQPPRFVVVCGPTATGKSRHRRAKYASGYALVDAAAIFLSLAPDEVLDFPDALRLELETAGQSLAIAAIRARTNIVTEVIGASASTMNELIDSLGAIGYTTHVDYVHAEVTQAWEWNLARSENNISAYYAEEFNIRWLVHAALADAQVNRRATAEAILAEALRPSMWIRWYFKGGLRVLITVPLFFFLVSLHCHLGVSSGSPRPGSPASNGRDLRLGRAGLAGAVSSLVSRDPAARSLLFPCQEPARTLASTRRVRSREDLLLDCRACLAPPRFLRHF